MAKRNPPLIGSRFTEPTIGRAWHADGAPYSEEDYKSAGLAVPTPEQLALWVEADRVPAHRNHPPE